MDSTRGQLAEALYQKGLALAEIASLKVRAFMFLKAMSIINSYSIHICKTGKYRVDDIVKGQKNIDQFLYVPTITALMK